MKRKSEIIFRLFFLCILLRLSISEVYAHPAVTDSTDCSKVLMVEPLAGHYLPTDTIYLPLINTSDSLLYYSLSLEVNTEMGWEPIIEDVYKSPLDKYEAQNIKIIPAGEIIVIPLTLSELFASTGLPDYGRMFRFRILAKNSPFDRDGMQYYSTVFGLQLN